MGRNRPVVLGMYVHKVYIKIYVRPSWIGLPFVFPSIIERIILFSRYEIKEGNFFASPGFLIIGFHSFMVFRS